MQAGDADAHLNTAIVLDPVMWHLLEASLEQSRVHQELDWGLQAVISLRVIPAAAIPLPDLDWEAQHLLTKMMAEDDVEGFLGTFEQVATRLAQGTRTQLIAPLLTGEAQWTYYALLAKDAMSYTQLKKEILAMCGLSAVQAASECHRWAYQPEKEPRAQVDDLLWVACHWSLSWPNSTPDEHDGKPNLTQIHVLVVIIML